MNGPVRKTLTAALLLLLIFSVNVTAHEVKTPVIVDTDMALDDVRALALLFKSPHVQVKAIIASDGSSSPDAGYRNALRVLEFLEVRDIPVGMGRRLSQPPPPWRTRSETLGWSDLPIPSTETEAPDAVSLITAVTQEAEQELAYVCLGPMTNLADALTGAPSLREKIGSVFFFGTPPDADPADWNTARDLNSVRSVSVSGIPLYFFHMQDDALLPFDSALLEDIRKLDSRSSQLIARIHEHEKIADLLQKEHFRAWDETVALYLDDPSLGKMESIRERPPLFSLAAWDTGAARQAYIRLLSGLTEKDLVPRMPVVLKRYPTNPGDLQEDVRPLIPEVITRHGLEEWKAILLTNELHRHLGIYSIIGAKMGIRARELLGASLDELRVESHAGIEPPLSCMNDGLQVSTGASLGRGTIRTREEASPFPAAAFVHGDTALHIRTTDEVVQKIGSDINEAIARYGALTPDYFKEIRGLSIRYWLELDRREIFDERIEATAKNR